MKRIAVLGLASLLSIASAHAQSVPVPSIWQNERGSQLIIYSIEPSGTFHGEFVNNAAGFQCRGTAFDVAGAGTTEHLHFAVAFGPCKSLVAWRGRIDGGTMETNWTLQRVNQADGSFSTMSGSDAFKRLDR